MSRDRTRHDLEPIAPREAVELYLEDIEGDLSPNSVQSRRYTLGIFADWCEGTDNGGEPRLEDLTNISGRDLHRFKNYRKDGLSPATLRTNLSTLRTFLDFCVDIDAVPSETPEKVSVPILTADEQARDRHIEADRAAAIVEYLDKFHYASLNHVLFALLWTTGARLGAMHSLDVDDIEYDEGRLHIAHRPEHETRLKNEGRGERYVALDDDVLAVLRDYCEHKRTPVTDDHGRRPLFSSTHGRMSRRYLPKRVYAVTRPCQYGMNCPAGKDPADCEYVGSMDDAVACPHNVAPHDIRRGAITHWLSQDVPDRIVSDRMDVSRKTLKRHYDARTEEEKAEVRREYLEDINDE